MSTETISPATAPTGAAPADTDSPRYRTRRRTVLVLGALLLAALVAGGTWGYTFFVQNPDDRALAPAEQQSAVDAAAAATVAILSYKADTVDSDLQAADSLITGQFADYYRSFTRDVVAPAAKEKQITTSASVVGKAISEFSEDTATVLLFVNQTTTMADAPQPSTTSTTLRVVLDRVDGSWLVSTFDPA